MIKSANRMGRSATERVLWMRSSLFLPSRITTLLCVCLLCCGGFAAKAQETPWQATVPQVSSAGFYDVMLSPEIAAHCKSNFADLRLQGEGPETPYLLRTEPLRTVKQVHHAHEIVLLSHAEDSSVIVFKNAQNAYINNIVLQVQNAKVRKRIRLTGSHDRETWFTI